MQSIQIEGTYSFIETVKTLKLNQLLKLIHNPNNRINSEAVGVYTLDNKKIGYLPFQKFQVDLKSEYFISKINLNQHSPIILIEPKINASHIIKLEAKTNNYNLKINDDLLKELEHFKRYLSRSGHLIKNIKITYITKDFINLLIETDTQKSIFYTVTKEYYQKNILKYDEFYNIGLMNKCIYQPFQIHRLETYIEKNYKPLEKYYKSKKSKLEYLLKYDLLNENNYSREIFKIDFKSDDIYEIKEHIKNNLDKYFKDYNLNGLAYNHDINTYCYLEFYNKDNILDISDKKFNQEFINIAILKLLIADRNIYNLYNPFEDRIYSIKIDGKFNNLLKLL